MSTTPYPHIAQLLEKRRLITPTKSDHRIIAWLHQHAPKAWERVKTEGPYIFRGTNGNTPFVAMPHTSYRPARNTADFYKIVLDLANPDWPSRGRSAVCSLWDAKAAEYQWGPSSSLFVVIPADGVPVGSVGQPDIWDLNVENLNGLVSWPERTVQGGKQPTWERYRSNLVELGDEVREYPIAVAVMDLWEDLTELIVSWAERHGTPEELMKILTDYCKYERFGCKLYPSSEQVRGGDSEVWFSGPAMMIPVDQINKLSAADGGKAMWVDV